MFLTGVRGLGLRDSVLPFNQAFMSRALELWVVALGIGCWHFGLGHQKISTPCRWPQK